MDTQMKPILQQGSKHRKETSGATCLIGLDAAVCFRNKIKSIGLKPAWPADNLLLGLDGV